MIIADDCLQFLILVHLHYFLSLAITYFVLPSNFIVPFDNNSNLQSVLILNTTLHLTNTILIFDIADINLYAWVICYSLTFLNDIFKIILNVWNRIWWIKEIKFIIISCGRYFKFIVIICRFNVLPSVINA